MLLETIKRYDTRNQVHLVSLDDLRAARRSIPPQLHSVPCLYVRSEKRYLYGKGVFDYLLLPASGKLVVGQAHGGPTQPVKGPNGPTEPAAFTLGAATLDDAFSPVETEDARDDRACAWASIEEVGDPPTSEVPPTCTETRTKKTLPDIESIRTLRETQLSTGFAE